MATKPAIKTFPLGFGGMNKRSSTRRGIQHHMEGYGGAQSVHAYHRSKGWSGIGYHFVVRKDGTIEQGRPLAYVGAHAEGANSDSVGVSVEGMYDKETMPDAQFASLVALWLWLFSVYGIGAGDLYRHKDVGDTSCPGKNFPWARLKAALKGEGKVLGYVVKSTRYLYPEAKADKAKRIKKLPAGTVVCYQRKSSGDWRKVKTLDGKTGWVKSTDADGKKVVKAIRDGRA